MTVTHLRSVIMNGGQGDVIMAVNGLVALQSLGVPFLTQDAVCYTRSLVAPMVGWMLPDIEVRPISEDKSSRQPRYYTSANTSWSTVLRNWFGSDYYINFASPRRRASFGYLQPKAVDRFRHWLTEYKLYGSLDWRLASPVYYGQRMWAPLAARLGFNEIDLLRGLHQSYSILRQRLRDKVATFERSADLPAVALFPVGKAYQTMPPSFAAELLAGLSKETYACYFAPGDAAIEAYRSAGLYCEVATDLEVLLDIVINSQVVATVDSFISHVAQLAANRHVAFMSHDMPQHTLHPAAPTQVVFTALTCSPCNYLMRHDVEQCAAGRAQCGVYDDSVYLARGRALLRQRHEDD